MVIIELLRALWQATVPVFLISFLLVWWALKHDYFGQVSSLKEMHQRVKQHSQASKIQKKNERKQKKGKKKKKHIQTLHHQLLSEPLNRLNPVHNKWLKFGGGFYGVIALLTYGVIEWLDVLNFLSNFQGVFDFLSGINMQLFINLLVNSIMNFVVAITWPAYWLDALRSHQPWVWLLAAYFGYWLGCRLALHQHAKNSASK